MCCCCACFLVIYTTLVNSLGKKDNFFASFRGTIDWWLQLFFCFFTLYVFVILLLAIMIEPCTPTHSNTMLVATIIMCHCNIRAAQFLFIFDFVCCVCVFFSALSFRLFSSVLPSSFTPFSLLSLSLFASFSLHFRFVRVCLSALHFIRYSHHIKRFSVWLLHTLKMKWPFFRAPFDHLI